MAAVLTIRPHVGVILAVDDDLLAALKQLFDDDRLLRHYAGNAVGEARQELLAEPGGS